MRILLLSDIHANLPALEAIFAKHNPATFDHIINCGDSLVYGPFPNETLSTLDNHKVISILGNTDKKILRLLAGKTMKKPKKSDKRIMYFWTKDILSKKNIGFLNNIVKTQTISLSTQSHNNSDPLSIGIYHGSPEDPDEFLFPHSPDERFRQLSNSLHEEIVVFGHSHTPFHKKIDDIHFINPGSVGRMFDGSPDASFAILENSNNILNIYHHRIPYDMDKLIKELKKQNFPIIYKEMYLTGRKLN